MAGLNLYAGGFGGVGSAQAPQYGSAQSYSSGMSAGNAAFAGPSTNPVPTMGQAISPTHGFGLAVWLGIGAVAGLVVLRNSLPN
jgi:hypothetical protein